MENKYTIDDLVKNALSDFKADYNPSDWSLMEQSLHDAHLDELVKDELEFKEVSYNSNDWTILESQLNYAATAGKLMYLKAFEIAALSLLMLTLVFWLPTPSRPVLKTPVTPNLPTQQTKKEPIAQIQETKAQPTIILPVAKKETAIVDDVPLLVCSVPTSFQDAKVASENTPIETPILKQANTVTLTSPTVNNATQILPVENKIDEIQATKAIFENVPTQLALLPTDFPRVGLSKNTYEKVRIGMNFSANGYMVTTPYTDDVEYAYKHYHSGFTGGVSFGFAKGNWETESGLYYTLLDYKPTISVINITGDINSGFVKHRLDHLEFNMISLPLTFNYSFANVNGMKLYAKLGTTFQSIAYSVEDHIIESNTSSAKISPRKTGGFLAGGSILENSMLSTQVGFGLEKYITPTISFIVEPTYSRVILGNNLGPNRDKIGAINLNIGVKTSL